MKVIIFALILSLIFFNLLFSEIPPYSRQVYNSEGAFYQPHFEQIYSGTWMPIGTGLNNVVWSLATTCSDIFVGGWVYNVGGNPDANYITRWDGTKWCALGTGLNFPVEVITSSGNDVYVGGWFTDAGNNPNADYIARWDGSQWHELGAGMNDWVFAIATSGENVYVGGDYRDAGGNPDLDYIALWDGTQWHALGTGLNYCVYTIAISGSDVYVGGVFSNAGGNPNANRIARWDGAHWHSLGMGIDGNVRAIAISGTDVYVGGHFTDAGGNPDADYIARWDGVQWHALGTGLNDFVEAIAISGMDVYVGGNFADAGGNPDADCIARWDGTQWNALGTGLNDYVRAIAISGTDVYAGGYFTDAGVYPDADYIARWYPFRDVSSVEFVSPQDTVIPSVQSIIGVITNIGSVTEYFDVKCIVKDHTESILLDTTINTILITGKFDTIDFGQVNMIHGQTYAMKMVVVLSGDMNTSNDTAISQTVCQYKINTVEENILSDPLGISLVYPSYAFPNHLFKMNLSLPIISDVKFYFCDITGRIIGSTSFDKLNPGNHDLIWECTDENGDNLSWGTYFFRLEASGEVINGKFILME